MLLVRLRSVAYHPTVMTYHPGIDRRRSIRLRGWDYRETGAYFVTICTFRRECFLDDQNLRWTVRTAWRRAICGGASPQEYEFVVMPNHVHGVVWLAGRPTIGASDSYEGRAVHDRGDASSPDHRSARPGRSPLRQTGMSGSLGAVVAAFKAASAKHINSLRGSPGAPVWQRNYYERVLRNERELEAARRYILDNPRKWREDKYHPARFTCRH